VTVLVDSDILIEVTRAKDDGILGNWADLSRSEDIILCSPVSVAELWHGARASEQAALSNLFDTLVCVPIDAEAGRLAGDYLRQYRKSHGLELGDALIASSAVLRGAVLWTLNRKHYPMKDISFF
jgi:predicted nucleic acid-binding protein